MRAALVRAGVDQAFGGWNAPVDPITGEFVYIPIPDPERVRAGLERPFSAVAPFVCQFGGERDASDLALPKALMKRNMHLDPDFETLTYGDDGARRGRRIARFEHGDLLVFYAGLRPCRPWPQRLVYAIIGVFRVDEVVSVGEVGEDRWDENAHTRRIKLRASDVVVRATLPGSGRLRRCIPIGEWRDGAYRVQRSLLEAWGDLSCRDGFIQRSAVPPLFRDPARFQRWLARQTPELIAMNNPRT
jgi:Nucleotide modification associated domain 3